MSNWLSIQYLRGFAALLVVWHHAYQQLAKIIDIQMPNWFDGRFGVDLFFVISGFIIWITTCDSQTSSLEFWRRRLIRIAPLYWLCSFGIIGLVIMAPGLFDRSKLDLGHVVQSLLFVPHFDPFKPASMRPLLFVGWTLNFEMFFYFVFGLCLVLRPRHRLGTIVVSLGSLVAVGAIIQPALDSALFHTYTNPLLLEFLAGVVIGSAYSAGWRPPSTLSYGLILMAIVSFIGLHYGLDVNTVEWRAICWGLPVSLLVAGLAGVERAVNLPHVASMRRLGDASYAIYLSHLFALGALGWVWNELALGPIMAPSAFVGLAMIMSIVSGIAIHHWVEQPLLRRLRFWDGNPPWLQRATPVLQGSGYISR